MIERNVDRSARNVAVRTARRIHVNVTSNRVVPAVFPYINITRISRVRRIRVGLLFSPRSWSTRTNSLNAKRILMISPSRLGQVRVYFSFFRFVSARGCGRGLFFAAAFEPYHPPRLDRLTQTKTDYCFFFLLLKNTKIARCDIICNDRRSIYINIVVPTHSGAIQV